VLGGALYSIGFGMNRDIDEAYRIARLVYDNGGMLCKRLRGSGTLILADDQIRSDERKDKNIKAVSKTDFCSLFGI
jgi:molybdate-binding protein